MVPNIAYYENLQKILRLAGGQIQWLPATRKITPKNHQKNQHDLIAWEQPSVDSLVKIRTKCQYETPYCPFFVEKNPLPFFSQKSHLQPMNIPGSAQVLILSITKQGFLFGG